ncbi:UNVERIFIED_CONTAM: hypothetical protein GTU68_011281 [Idotea baltica]|nr:hypothetical protein [Idotea baltica]
MNIRPLHDRVVVRRMEEETMSAGGIVLPGGASEKPDRGEIVAVGKGRVTDSGDTVLFKQYGPTEIKVDGEDLLVMNEGDIIAVIEA